MPRLILPNGPFILVDTALSEKPLSFLHYAVVRLLQDLQCPVCQWTQKLPLTQTEGCREECGDITKQQLSNAKSRTFITIFFYDVIFLPHRMSSKQEVIYSGGVLTPVTTLKFNNGITSDRLQVSICFPLPVSLQERHSRLWTKHINVI